MTACLNFEQQISALLDGELPEAERQALEAHLETCESCAAAYRAFSGLSAAMQDLAFEPPVDLKARVLERIEEEKITPISEAKKPRNWKYIAAMAASFVLIIGVAVFAGRDTLQRGAPAGITFTNPPQATGLLGANAEGSDDAPYLGLTPLPDDKSAEALALLTDPTEAEPPAAEAEPACVTVVTDETGREVVTTFWIDGEDVVFTDDGELFQRAENAAGELTALLASDTGD